MRVLSIIAEYNPFHAGHAFQIQQAREKSQADFVVVIMSGDFVQRGKPAIMDKYLRTRLALLGGADLVLELPVWMATASAADFARGAVSILDGLGCVDVLCFGSEKGDLDLLQEAADCFLTEPPVYKETLKSLLSQGRSFPRARKEAWETMSQKSGAFLDLPNNILGIAYLMALKQQNSSIRPLTIQRRGMFHSKELPSHAQGTADAPVFASATAIRACLLEAASGGRPLPVKSLPYEKEQQALLLREYRKGFPVAEETFWPLLKARLLDRADQAEIYADFSTELANRLKNCYFTAGSYEELASSLKTAAFTRSRIDRALLHLLLGITQKDILTFKQSEEALYARVLGFRKEQAAVLSQIRQTSRLPVLTRALMPDTLTSLAKRSYALDVYGANLYESMKCIQYPGTTPIHEYRQKLIVL